MASLKLAQVSLCQWQWLLPQRLLKRTCVHRERMNVEPISKNYLSPHLIKRPPTTVVHKDPQSLQPMMIDHVENEQEGQMEPS